MICGYMYYMTILNMLLLLHSPESLWIRNTIISWEHWHFVSIIDGQKIGYIMACGLCLFVCKLHNLIVIIMQTYLKALN